MGKSTVIDTVGKWVPGLRKGAGHNWIGFCPIHGEQVGRSKPSFSFNESTGQWQCFTGCGAGKLPSLLKRLRKSEDYVKRTMDRLSPHLTDPKKIREREERRATRKFYTDFELPEKLLGLWEFIPESLEDAGFDLDMLEDHDIGFDPKHERITFPIRDLGGTLAGVSGKAMAGDDKGKYVVYEREMRDYGLRNYHFNNRNYCWRWDRVYPALYSNPDVDRTEPLYVCEGFKAALWLVQHGYLNTVALMGTSLSLVQKAFILRIGHPVVLCLDNDKWGRKGALKARTRLSSLPISFMRYPRPELDLQPDDLFEDELHEALNNTMTPREWRREYRHGR